MINGYARFILSLTACVFMAGPLSAQTAPIPPAGGSAAPVGTTPAPKPVSKATQKELQDNLNAMDAAIKKKDINGVMKYFAPDYKMKDIKGKTVTLSQIRDGYQSYFTQAHDITTASSTVQKVEAKKESYAVTGQIHASGDHAGRAEQNARNGAGQHGPADVEENKRGLAHYGRQTYCAGQHLRRQALFRRQTETNRVE